DLLLQHDAHCPPNAIACADTHTKFTCRAKSTERRERQPPERASRSLPRVWRTGLPVRSRLCAVWRRARPTTLAAPALAGATSFAAASDAPSCSAEAQACGEPGR